MINRSQLQKMRDLDITKIDREDLADIRDVKIDSSLPEDEKLERYINEIVNPFCFRYGDTPVKIRFVSESRALKKSLSDYFKSLK